MITRRQMRTVRREVVHRVMVPLHLCTLLVVVLLACEQSNAQLLRVDKCGYDDFLAKAQRELLGDKWGYSYDSLLADLQMWEQSPYVNVQSIGKSVQDRDLWELTIADPAARSQISRTVYVHARTHPGEVQSFWVTRAMIDLLLSDEPTARALRSSVLFSIVPMYNPDGVELEFPRENANGIDIESNWATSPSQPEVVALRNRFLEIMWSTAPIVVALNMHSAYACTRYFVFHDSVGTSNPYAALERQFIEQTRTYFPGGFQPWNYFVSWQSGPSLVYPESWFWVNYREAVMALTYEDMNCSAAGEFGQTASAIIRGVAHYLEVQPSGVGSSQTYRPLAVRLGQAYPHPLSHLNSETATIEYELPSPQPVRLTLYDILGRVVLRPVDGERPAGVSSALLHVQGLPSGTYFYRLETPLGSIAHPLVITR